MRSGKGVVAVAVVSLVVGLAPAAAADLIRLDPNDVAHKLDLARVESDVYRGDYFSGRARLVRSTLHFREGIPWRKVFTLETRFDSRRGKKLDYSIHWGVLNGDFYCWLMKGFGLVGSGPIVLDEEQVADYGRTRRSVTCSIPVAALRPTKMVRWNAFAALGIYKTDAAPNSGVYPRI